MPKERSTKSPSLEDDIRFPVFRELYVQNGGNARRAAKGAGYPPEYVRAHAYELARRIGTDLTARRVLVEQGNDLPRILGELGKIALKAEVVKWNSEAKRWDKFVDLHARLKALDMMARIHDAYPSLKHEGVDGGVPVKVVIETSIGRPNRGTKQQQVN